MNRLGLNVTSPTGNITNVINDIVDNAIALPEIGDTGPGGGIIFYEELNGNQKIYYETTAIVDPLSTILPSTSTTWETLIQSIDNAPALNSIDYAAGELEGLVYVSNSEIFHVADITNTAAEAILGFTSGSGISNKETGWFAESRYLTSAGVAYLYRETNINSEEVGIQGITIGPEGSKSISVVSFDPTTTIPQEYVMAHGSLPSYQIRLIVIRKFIIEIPPTILALSNPPLAVNTFSTEDFGDSFNPQYIATYGGTTSQTVSAIIDRYRRVEQCLTYTEQDLSNNKIAFAVPGAELTRPVSFMSKNRQIIVQLTSISPTKPQDPWYDKATGEVLTMKANILCFREKKTVATLLQALSGYDQTLNSINVTEDSRVALQTTISGQTAYFTKITFKIDVSDIPVYNDNNELKTVLDLAWDGSASKYKFMLFELQNIKFESNKRIGKTSRIKYLQTGLCAVPTWVGGLFNVGFDASAFLYDAANTTTSFNTSIDITQPNTEYMDTAAIDYEFNTYNSSPTTETIAIVPFYQTWAAITFDTRTGAIDPDYVTINLSSNTVTYRLGVDITVGHTYAGQPSSQIQFKMKYVITDLNDVETSSATITDVAINADEEYTILLEDGSPDRRPLISLPSNSKLKVLFYVDYNTSPTNLGKVTIAGGYRADYPTSGSITSNTTLIYKYTFRP